MRAALYLRLSREDEERKGESQSIVNQRLFLSRFAAENGMEVAGVYIDDGFTGTNFDRPGFRRMIDDAESKLFDVILVKDLSRLGRDHIETGYYCERYFPSRGLRFIAVNDGIDTAAETAGNEMGLFKAAFNDLYARDISRKVVAALDAKKRAGVFIGSRPPYGYRRDGEKPGTLLPYSPEADVVRRIFSERLLGRPFREIARLLDADGISPPLAEHWNDTTVRRILTNPTYCGDLTQNRSRKINYKLTCRRTLPPEEWVTVKETHPPLVSRERFYAVASGIGRRLPKEKSPVDGLLFCGDCGSPLYRTGRGKQRYLVCGGWKRSGGKLCRSHCCREELPKEALVRFFSELVGENTARFSSAELRFLLFRRTVRSLKLGDGGELQVVFRSTKVK